MSIIKKKTQHNFTIITNDICQREDLSYEAKGVLLELLSRPDDWVVYKAQLERYHTGKTKLTRIFKELQDLGYMKIVTKRFAGKINERIWEIYETPNVKSSTKP